MHHDDDHDGGLNRDLKLFQNGLIARRRALSLIGMAAGSVAITGGGSLLLPQAAKPAEPASRMRRKSPVPSRPMAPITPVVQPPTCSPNPVSCAAMCAAAS